MINRAIKVIKRNGNGGPAKPVRVINALKAATDIRRKNVIAVNDWISERRESSRMEKVFSDSTILAWKIMSKDYKETMS